MLLSEHYPTKKAPTFKLGDVFTHKDLPNEKLVLVCIHIEDKKEDYPCFMGLVFMDSWISFLPFVPVSINDTHKVSLDTLLKVTGVKPELLCYKGVPVSELCVSDEKPVKVGNRLKHLHSSSTFLIADCGNGCVRLVHLSSGIAQVQVVENVLDGVLTREQVSVLVCGEVMLPNYEVL